MGKKSNKNKTTTTSSDKKKKKHESNSNNNNNIIIADDRFSHVHSDPRFQNVPKHQSKVSIDPRFTTIFTDKNFATSSAPIDKRGKLINQNNNSVNPLRHYYNIEEEDESKKKKKKKQVEIIQDDDEDDSENEEFTKLDIRSSSDDDDDELTGSEVDESENGTDSSDADTDDEDEVYSDDEPEKPEENIAEIEQETRRLAVVNMDWGQVRAVDLYVMLSSFLPKGGQILSVSVYPSEFGLKRMEEEAVKGPVGLFDSEEEKSDDDNNEIDDEKLRAYEKSRLGYYFAVVECDSSDTADHIYKNCDGLEFESTSIKLDLRFIPDTMQFEHLPREIATEPPSKYEPLDFHAHALQQSKIHLSWDDDEPQRAKTLRRKLNDEQLGELELKEFLASDDGESDDDDNDEIAGIADGQSDKKFRKLDKYRALLQGGEGSDEDGSDNDNDMEVTFNTGLEDISKRILEKKKDKNSETVWEANLRKMKEKKKARRNRAKDSSEDDSSDADQVAPEQPDDFFVEEPSMKNSKIGKNTRKGKQEHGADKEQEASIAELELLLADDQGADHNLKGYNMKPKKAKGKKGKEVPAEDKLPSVDYNDPRFQALFTSPLFALDPTDAQYKRSAVYARQVAQKLPKGVGEEIRDREQKKAAEETQLPSDSTASKKSEKLQYDSMPSKVENPELSSMIRSVKRKAQQYQDTSNSKTSKKVMAMQSRRLLPKISSKKARVSKN